MRGENGSAMSDGALNNNDNFRSTQKLRRHDCEDGSAENQVDSATKAADVYASPVQGEGDRRRRWKGCWKMKSLLSNPEFVTIFLSHHT